MLHLKVGFIGMGNMAQAIVKGLVESKVVAPAHIFASNRTPGKLHKAVEQWGIQAMPTNEQVVDAADIIILAMKPQDLPGAVEPIASAFHSKQIVVSIAAGITFDSLEKKFPDCRIARIMPNTPAVIQKGVIGYMMNDDDIGLQSVIEDLCSPLGYVVKAENEEQLEALTVSCSSGTGFVFELMMYFQDWIEERGFDTAAARRMVIETFAGASMLALQSKDQQLEDLQAKVTSKKGVTAAGLESMRELEIERLLRYSFEKAALRNQELAKEK